MESYEIRGRERKVETRERHWLVVLGLSTKVFRKSHALIERKRKRERGKCAEVSERRRETCSMRWKSHSPSSFAAAKRERGNFGIFHFFPL